MTKRIKRVPMKKIQPVAHGARRGSDADGGDMER